MYSVGDGVGMPFTGRRKTAGFLTPALILR